LPSVTITIFYFVLCSVVLFKLPFIKKAKLGNTIVTLLFALKCLAGVAYARFYQLPKYYSTADTWRFYKLSLDEKQWLLHNPYAFVKDIFTHGYQQTGNVFIGSNSYWNDLKSNIIIKLMALFNVLTADGYYSNLVLFNLLYFVGLIALYRVFISLYPTAKWAAIIGIFLFPSTLFWCSGIHKDGLVLSAVGVAIFCFHFKIVQKPFNLKAILLILACFALTFVLRSYVLLALLPFLLGWWVSKQINWPPIRIFTMLYLAGVVLFFALPYISSGLNFPGFLANKQHEFLLLSGGSAVSALPLQPTFTGFLIYLPTALDMALFQPHLTAGFNVGALLAFGEQILIVLLLAAFWLAKKPAQQLPVITGMLFFGISVLLIAGYSVTFSGAVVRYRSFVIPFLLTPLLCSIDVQKLIKSLSPKTN